MSPFPLGHKIIAKETVSKKVSYSSYSAKASLTTDRRERTKKAGKIQPFIVNELDK